MPYLHVQFKVQTYQGWREVFDENAGLRQEFGCQSETVFVNAANENEVTILLGFDTVGEAQTFSQSPELREAMQRAGVIPPPQLTIVEER